MATGGRARWIFLAVAALVFTFSSLSDAARAVERHHGISAFGELGYGADFTHFKYVNPDAPKGGRLSMIGTAGLITFNSLNAFIVKGDAAQGLQFLFDSLMTRAEDEPDAVYGLVAQSAEVADDGKSVTFFLRPEAHFADGTPVTAGDVVFSFDILKEKGDPRISLQLRDVASATAVDTHIVRYEFTGELVRDLPLIVAGLPILSKAFYATRPFEETTMEPPLGSGPYKVGRLSQGRYITYVRREDYWARDLPVNRGRFNFAELRYEYFRDRTAEFEALKAGEYDLREEFTSRTWATEYKIPQVTSGKMILATLPDERPSGTQGFFMNTRRAKFADPRVRQALDYAFDFEWTNKNQFHELYNRTHSWFENSVMKAEGPPSPQELTLLEPFKSQLPEAAFAPAYLPPVSDGSGQDRKLLREAGKLLDAAGWTVKDGRRVNAKGEQLDIEVLTFSPTFERIIAPWVKNLKILGIDARMRLVDPAQYQSRLKAFDFDITTQRYVMSMTPGAELRAFFGSQSAAAAGSQNLAGVSDPAVDALIDRIILANSRDELNVAARALDRVLRANHYWVSHWYKAAHNLAHWDKFSWPATKPAFGRGVIDTWWYDAEKAARLQAAR